MMISLPTGTKVFNWLCTVLGNSLLILVSSSAIFALIFLVMFTLGGSTGVILGNAAVDVALHDTYYVVAHFHFVLSLGAVIALFLGILHFQDIFFNSFLHSLCARNARYHFVISSFGINLTFTPIHFLSWFSCGPPSFFSTFKFSALTKIATDASMDYCMPGGHTLLAFRLLISAVGWAGRKKGFWVLSRRKRNPLANTSDEGNRESLPTKTAAVDPLFTHNAVGM
jgi:heme/copper-type cytochrome/quinol oxidase subunit 1